MKQKILNVAIVGFAMVMLANIIGFTAGVLGIGVTLLLVMLANIIIQNLTGLANLAALPWAGALILVGISMALTLIAGLIPARLAAKKDPVVALRSE